jgi:hypothetical protein
MQAVETFRDGAASKRSGIAAALQLPVMRSGLICCCGSPAGEITMDERVRERLSRRRVLKIVAVLGGAVAIPMGARNAAPQGKVSKAQAKYQDKPKDGQSCSNCAHFISPSQCKVVEGPVSPNGWSTLYTAKS